MGLSDRSEAEAALQTIASGVAGRGVGIAVDAGGAELHAEVVGDVEVGELGIDVGINNGDEVYTDEAEDAEVALAAVVVLAVLEHALQIVLVGLHIVSGGKEIFVAGGAGVVVHDVEVGLRVVAIHLVVPVEGVGTTEETAVDDGELPVFVVVDLSATGEHKGAPRGLAGVGGEGGEALPAQLTAGGGISLAAYGWGGGNHGRVCKHRVFRDRCGDAQLESCCAVERVGHGVVCAVGLCMQQGRQAYCHDECEYVTGHRHAFSLSNRAMMRSSSCSSLKVMAILPFPLALQVSCTSVWKKEAR